MTQQVDILKLVEAFGRRWRSWFVGSVLVGVLAIIYASFVLPKEYKATAVVLPPTGSSSLGILGMVTGMSGAGDLESSLIDGQELLTLFNTRTLRVKLIEEFSLQERYDQKSIVGTLRILPNYMLIEEEVQGGLATPRLISLNISMWDEDPEFAAKMVNWLVDAADEIVTEFSTAKAAWEVEYLQDRLRRTRQEHEADQDRLEEFASQTGLFALEGQLMEVAALIATQQAQLAGLEIEDEVLARDYSPRHPARTAISAAIASSRRSLSELRAEGANGLVPALDSLPKKQREYFDLFLEANIKGELLKQLVPRVEIAEMQQEYDRPRIRRLSAAQPQDYKDRPRRAWVVLGISFLFQVLWFTWFLSIEYLANLREANPGAYARLRHVAASFSKARRR